MVEFDSSLQHCPGFVFEERQLRVCCDEMDRGGHDDSEDDYSILYYLHAHVYMRVWKGERKRWSCLNGEC